ncbi:nuclear transport factor 2 family protein [Mesorhizobium sp. CAU 1741]|uniref:nuclear transport factor 2 family protein n=1 Tax=Mesorhizobium sp. CAU 1741 TaxID=3140366 RepID=UPI00325A64CB
MPLQPADDPDPVAVAKACLLAYAASDREAIERVIAPDFHFTSPLDNRIDRTAYFERCWPNSAFITDFEFVRIVRDGDVVLVTYEGTNQDGKRFRNTEALTIREGQIVEVEVYFGWNVPHDAPEGGFIQPPA